MKVKLLLGTATIALVGFVGAVYATLSQDMPDSAPEPVYSAVEVVDEPTAEIQGQEIAEVEAPVVEQAPVARTAPKKVETDNPSDTPIVPPTAHVNVSDAGGTRYVHVNVSNGSLPVNNSASLTIGSDIIPIQLTGSRMASVEIHAQTGAVIVTLTDAGGSTYQIATGVTL